ncbi:MAG: PadR family transcriptional regulator [Micromonosporaceae bacterium]
MVFASPTTYGLLGLLATRSWTGYELTQQVRRSLRFVWSVSDGHIYREQKRLADLGWAAVEEEPAGRRSRKRYTITPSGRAALAAWLETEPEEPHFQIEGVLRAFFGDQAAPSTLAGTLERTAEATRAMLEEMVGFAAEYLEEGGPLSMLEAGVSGPGQERHGFRGRPMYVERLHAVALAIDATTRLLVTLEEFSRETATEVASWTATTDPALTAATRRRLEAVVGRASPGAVER